MPHDPEKARDAAMAALQSLLSQISLAEEFESWELVRLARQHFDEQWEILDRAHRDHLRRRVEDCRIDLAVLKHQTLASGIRLINSRKDLKHLTA